MVLRRGQGGHAPARPRLLAGGATWAQLEGPQTQRAFNALAENDAVRTALDTIFGPNQWLQPKPGAQILFTLPKPGAWVLPGTWHMDCGFERPSWPVHGVKLFAFFGEVGPKGGGTMVLPGTHRVVDEYRWRLPPGTGAGMANWHRLLRQHPFLAQLLNGHRMPDGGRSLVGQVGDVNGVPVEVRELTGSLGTWSSPTCTSITPHHPTWASSHVRCSARRSTGLRPSRSSDEKAFTVALDQRSRRRY